MSLDVRYSFGWWGPEQGSRTDTTENSTSSTSLAGSNYYVGTLTNECYIILICDMA